MKTLALLFLLLQSLIGGRAEFDKTFTEKDGPQQCVFTVTNRGSEPLTILSAVSSCGCTGVRWTRASIAPGESGTIEATYSNEDGPFPFDKTVTVYLAGIKKPVILHLRGVVTKK